MRVRRGRFFAHLVHVRRLPVWDARRCRTSAVCLLLSPAVVFLLPPLRAHCFSSVCHQILERRVEIVFAKLFSGSLSWPAHQGPIPARVCTDRQGANTVTRAHVPTSEPLRSCAVKLLRSTSCTTAMSINAVDTDPVSASPGSHMSTAQMSLPMTHARIYHGRVREVTLPWALAAIACVPPPRDFSLQQRSPAGR